MIPFRLGAHLVVKRKGCTHHGIYIGNGRVIHYACFSKAFKKDKVLETTYSKFADGAIVEDYKLEYKLKVYRYNPRDIIERAKSRLYEDKYNLVFNNCEHFANWCTHGDNYSSQCETAAEEIDERVIITMGGLPGIAIATVLRILREKGWRK